MYLSDSSTFAIVVACRVSVSMFVLVFVLPALSTTAIVIIIIISMLILAYCPVGKSSLLLLVCYFFPF